MMSMRRVGNVGIFIALLLIVTAIANALTITANPSSVIVKAGSSNYTTVSFYESTINGTYVLNTSINNSLITVTVYGPYLDSAFTQPVIVAGVNYTTSAPVATPISWPGSAGTTYYFKIVFSAPSTITTTQSFICTVSGAAANLATYAIKISGTAVYGLVPPIPELTTGILLSIGLAGIVLTRKFK